jgi:hypothetical protein
MAAEGCAQIFLGSLTLLLRLTASGLNADTALDGFIETPASIINLL